MTRNIRHAGFQPSSLLAELGCQLAVLGCMLACVSARAQEVVRIDLQGVLDARIPIAAPPFSTSPEASAYSGELASVIESDLDFTGLFLIVPRTQYPRGFPGFTPDPTQIDFDGWRGTTAEHLVYANVGAQGTGLVAECRLFDVLVGQQLVGKRLVAEQKWSRLLAHQFADEIVRHLSGEAGIASSEIAFSVGQPGKKEIYVSDYDGGALTQITEHGSISIKPKFSPDGRKIAYLSYKDRYPFLYIYDRDSGVSTALSKRVGLNHAPAWSPDGSKIALCLSKDGNTEIYVKSPDGSGEQRLTDDRGSDTSPVYSPDGSRIAFVSDRAGRPQIHVMSSSGGAAQRISFQGGNAYDPVWSPNGQHFAYVVEKPGEGLEIYMMNADGSAPRRLTDSSGSNESPSWSPDSRHVMFSSNRDGAPQLYTVTIETGQVRRVARLSNMRCEGPTWGPRRS